MDDRMVTLYKSSFTDADWFRLSLAFDFNVEDDFADIHVIIDQYGI